MDFPEQDVVKWEGGLGAFSRISYIFHFKETRDAFGFIS
jgi:hypothetical protein